ncbi:fluoride efflux transporter CrcB [Sporosarcina sp. P26b]|uniref:fluoride efflux transporter FluC n=1 Tax=Sporosarcina sp. P26b TaxID=2048253 RepID=UPI000C16C86E|nr:CrcB family protein [Sporosarcina sp. P26b]PIC97376.1 fluoride efflux transporter CrcB [Sporosarcina sp. P26b]
MNAGRERLYIGVAGAIGASTRLLIGQLLIISGSFPVATFTINMIGTIILCYIVERARLVGSLSPLAVTVITTGFLGAFTTFSAVSVETVELLRDGFHVLAGVYVSSSVVGGLAMAALGFLLARRRSS